MLTPCHFLWRKQAQTRQKSHFLRPTKVVLEGALFSKSPPPPPKYQDTFDRDKGPKPFFGEGFYGMFSPPLLGRCPRTVRPFPVLVFQLSKQQEPYPDNLVNRTRNPFEPYSDKEIPLRRALRRFALLVGLSTGNAPKTDTSLLTFSSLN